MKSENLSVLANNGLNVPKFIVIEDENEIDMSFSSKSLFAVRSSFDVEDSEDFSYAGQFESYLNVKKEDIKNTVLKVKNSYKNIKDFSEETHCKVIIQEMVESELSGVLFTANPIGVLNEMVIVVGEGLGCNVVEDKEDTTTYFYNIDDKLYETKKVNNSPLLNKEQILELVEIGQKIENIFENKMDIEFAIENDEIFVLQARPITTLNMSNSIVLDNSNIVESYPGVSLPLTQDFVKDLYYRIFKCSVSKVSENEMLVNLLDDNLKQMVDVANGRLYYRISNWYSVLKFLPFSNYVIHIWQEMLGVRNKTIVNDEFSVPLNVKLKVIKNFFKELRNCPKNMEVLNEFFKEEMTKSKEKYSKINNNIDDLLSLYIELKNVFIERWYVTLVNDMYAFIYTFFAGKRHKNLIANIRGLESLKPVLEVNKLIREYDKKSSNFSKLFDNYISEYGDRCLEELKLETKTYRTNPELLIEYITTHEENVINNISETYSNNLFVKRSKIGIYNREISRMNRCRLYGFVREIFLRIGEILVEQGRIDNREDIFYLYEKELNNSDMDLKKLVLDRKEEYKQYEKIPAYSRLVFTDKIINKQVFDNDYQLLSDTILLGIGTSVGIVEGEVLKIESAELDIDTTDKILVTKMTDPGWVFLIKNSKGIVAEQGSLLSHTAIITRELKKPSVVNVKNAMTLLNDGDRIKIDGEKGTIEIIERV